MQTLLIDIGALAMFLSYVAVAYWHAVRPNDGSPVRGRLGSGSDPRSGFEGNADHRQSPGCGQENVAAEWNAEHRRAARRRDDHLGQGIVALRWGGGWRCRAGIRGIACRDGRGTTSTRDPAVCSAERSAGGHSDSATPSTPSAKSRMAAPRLPATITRPNRTR